MPLLSYFVRPKHPSGNCYVSCFPTDKTAWIAIQVQGRHSQLLAGKATSAACRCAPAAAAAAFYSAKSIQLKPIKGEEKMKSPRLQSSMFITLNTDGERIEYQVSEVCFVIFELFTSWFPHFRILHPAFLNQSE